MTLEDRIAAIQKRADYRAPAAFGVGLATFGIGDLDRPFQVVEGAATLDTWYPVPCLGEASSLAALLADALGHAGGTASYRLEAERLDALVAELAPLLGDADSGPAAGALTRLHQQQEAARADAARYASGEVPLPRVLPRRVVVSFIGALDDEPLDAHDAYLRLHLLSSRKVRPHGCSLAGVFGKLSNVVWTSQGPFLPEGFESTRGVLRSQGLSVQVHSIDKFPRMTDYVVPTGVRIADADRVRLGAHLAEGTTVMHEGFCNFNAGTLGSSMVEGRISAGVVVGDGSDIGGGASTMGTLSGGGNIVIAIGEKCLLGANSGCGIPLGDGCTIEAGLYITAGTKVTTQDGKVLKAREVAGRPDLLFRRNSVSGAVEVVEKHKAIELNEELHKN